MRATFAKAESKQPEDLNIRRPAVADFGSDITADISKS